MKGKKAFLYGAIFGTLALADQAPAQPPPVRFVATPSSYPAGPPAHCVAVGDFNGDGILDLAVANSGALAFPAFPGMVTILLGNGDGSFRQGESYVAGKDDGTAPALIAVGDFNGDGLLDIVVANSTLDGQGVVTIFLGNGDGTFQAGRVLAAELTPSAVVAADFNADGKLDLALTNIKDGTLRVFLGNGDGTFGPAQSYGTSSQGGALSLAVGDFNGDGNPDLVVVDPQYPQYPPNQGMGNVFLGTGDGTFHPAFTFSAGLEPRAVAVGDFNGDGKQDIVTANFSYISDPRRGFFSVFENDVRVFLGNGDGTFQAGQAFAEDGFPAAVVIGDFNGDGIPDLAVLNGLHGGSVTVMLGAGDGSFVAPQPFVVGGISASLAVGDFNGDGHLDLAVADYANPGAVTILLNAAGGGN